MKKIKVIAQPWRWLQIGQSLIAISAPLQDQSNIQRQLQLASSSGSGCVENINSL